MAYEQMGIHSMHLSSISNNQYDQPTTTKRTQFYGHEPSLQASEFQGRRYTASNSTSWTGKKKRASRLSHFQSDGSSPRNLFAFCIQRITWFFSLKTFTGKLHTYIQTTRRLTPHPSRLSISLIATYYYRSSRPLFSSQFICCELVMTLSGAVPARLTMHIPLDNSTQPHYTLPAPSRY